MTATDPTTTAPQPAPLDLDAIDPRWNGTCNCEDQEAHGPDCRQGHGPGCDPGVCYSPYGCAERLVAEVRRLRAELDIVEASEDAAAVIYRGQRDTARIQATELRTEADHMRERIAELDAAPAAPAKYQLPAEPPPEVTELWDRDGDHWERNDEDHGYDSGWITDTSDGVWEWPDLVAAVAPLSSVPPAGTEGDHG